MKQSLGVLLCGMRYVVHNSPKNMPTLRCSKNPGPPHTLVFACPRLLFQVLGVYRPST